MLKAGFISLGCAKNLVDTEVMLGVLTERRIEITSNPAEAEVIIVNTCGFIDSAKEESIATILQMAEYKKTGKCRSLIVAGCLGQRYRRDLLDELPEVDAIVGTSAWRRIAEAVALTLEGRRLVLTDETDALYDDKTTRLRTTPAYSAYVKIAEGCSNRCSYCVIPLVRGPYRSRPIESIAAEAAQLARNGVREINLVAQDTTGYGRDLYGAPRLTQLLEELVKVEGVRWIRLLYCYPQDFSDELIRLMAAEPKICKYVDLPLQHADDAVLRAMNRRDTRGEVEVLLRKIRAAMPDAAVRTTFIVGFPGETQAQYETLKNFMLEQKFDKVGVFTYSREEGTKAYDLPDQIDDEVKQARYHELMALQCKISEEINRSWEGKRLTVLIEGRDREQAHVAYGRSHRDAPDVDGQVYVEDDGSSEAGAFIETTVLQGYTYDMLAEKITK